MTDKEQELYEAAKAILPLLRLSYENSSYDELAERARVPRSQRLRQDADELDARDAIILRFRAAIAAIES